MKEKFDIIVVGAGHAGCEAAASAAKMGSKVLLITMDMTKIAQMSCNPAIGGIAKGQIVREIDALGGLTGIITDRAMIQFRMLNRSKGPAMWSPRAQCDRIKFSIEWRKELEKEENLFFWNDIVKELIIERKIVKGIKTQLGVTFFSNAIILTSGTFQNGIIYVGRNKVEGGRISELPSKGISNQLKEIGFEVGRMKTGTPARLDGRTINFKILEEQKNDKKNGRFSFLVDDYLNNSKVSCYITYTNPEVHKILEKGFIESPLYNGIIKGIGPRYCPSIEDKIVTFHTKKSHQLFLEPEGLNTSEFYLNGFSSSLPWEIQYNAIRKIKGLEKVKIFRPGYAIEYDYFQPTQLFHTLETKQVKGLYFAGQVNGTTGYEEAAAQGLIAGINAHLKIKCKNEFILKRDEAYIGVLIDDLVTKGVDEPYRLFTSRAEYRILLRQDNADERLTQKAYDINLASDCRINKYLNKKNIIDILINHIDKKSVKPDEINTILNEKRSAKICEKVKLKEILQRPQISIYDLLKIIVNENNELIKLNEDMRNEILEELEIKIKYEGYIKREKLVAEKIKRLEEIDIPEYIKFSEINSISTEAKMKLSKINPKTIGQASRISGVSPADINVLLINLGR
jgi:tRNA uridine 5-carboxymethylaminomethyl modification enzyme